MKPRTVGDDTHQVIPRLLRLQEGLRPLSQLQRWFRTRYVKESTRPKSKVYYSIYGSSSIEHAGLIQRGMQTPSYALGTNKSNYTGWQMIDKINEARSSFSPPPKATHRLSVSGRDAAALSGTVQADRASVSSGRPSQQPWAPSCTLLMLWHAY